MILDRSSGPPLRLPGHCHNPLAGKAFSIAQHRR
jgi:hypothetical protein